MPFSVPSTTRLHLGLIAAVLLVAAGCATVGDSEQTGEAPAGRDTFAPLAGVDDAVELPGRISAGGVVAEIPAGWIGRRHHNARPFIKAELLSPTQRATAYLINVASGGPLLPETAFRFILAEVVFLDNVPSGDYTQALPDGSHYAGVDVRAGTAVRVRMIETREGFLAVVVVGPPEEIATSDLDAHLRSLRATRDGEASYRLRDEGLSALEVGREPWLWMEDYGSGVTLVSLNEGEETFCVLVPGREFDIERSSLRSTEVWIGSRRVMLRGGASTGEPGRELYGFSVDGEQYQLLLARTRGETEGALIEEPAVQQMLLSQIVVGGVE